MKSGHLTLVPPLADDPATLSAVDILEDTPPHAPTGIVDVYARHHRLWRAAWYYVTGCREPMLPPALEVARDDDEAFRCFRGMVQCLAETTPATLAGLLAAASWLELAAPPPAGPLLTLYARMWQGWDADGLPREQRFRRLRRLLRPDAVVVEAPN